MILDHFIPGLHSSERFCNIVKKELKNIATGFFSVQLMMMAAFHHQYHLLLLFERTIRMIILFPNQTILFS
jgi:hypothetical protein